MIQDTLRKHEELLEALAALRFSPGAHVPIRLTEMQRDMLLVALSMVMSAIKVRIADKMAPPDEVR